LFYTYFCGISERIFMNKEKLVDMTRCAIVLYDSV